MATPRILVVDDDAPRAQALARELTERGYRGVEVTAPASTLGTSSERAMRPVPEDRFFETALDLLCVLDFNGYFARVNPAWERTLGFNREELTSRPFIDFVHPDDRPRTLERNAKVRAGEEALAFENRYLCRDGSYRWLRWNATPSVRDQVIYSVARDVTASKAADAERERLVHELQEALAEVNSLRDILPICSYCRKVRDDENYWHTVEAYIAHHTSTQFSHGICPSCLTTVVEPQLRELEADRERQRGAPDA